MKYSKMMTIIENTKVKLEKEEEIKTTTDYFLQGKNEKMDMIVNLRQKLHERKQKKIKQNLTKNTDLTNINEISKKPIMNLLKDNPSLRESSFLLINSSSFEIDSKAIGDRSLSMYLKDNENDDEKEENFKNYSASNKIKSFKGLTPSEKDILVSQEKEFEEMDEEETKRDKEKKFSFNRRKSEILNSKNKGEKIVVHKRFMYYDDDG